jgi:hypothetical protein
MVVLGRLCGIAALAVVTVAAPSRPVPRGMDMQFLVHALR